MKVKILLAAALLSYAVNSAMAAPIGVVEYDYNKVKGADAHSQYVAAGIIFPTSLGSFDGYWQGVRSTTKFGIDNLNGFEFGYSTPSITLGRFNVTPRLAYGTMNNIDFGGGVEGRARYVLGSVEAATPLTDSLSGYASVSHMNGLNEDAISASNRVQLGVDYVISKNFTARLGLSSIRQLSITQNGAVSMLFVSF